MAPLSFELFPELPAEIRVEIWAAALPQPRLVQVEERVTEDYHQSKYDDIIAATKERMAKMGQDYTNCEQERLLLSFRNALSNIRAWPYTNHHLHPGSPYVSPNRPRPSLAPLRLLEECGFETIIDTTCLSYLYSRTPIPALLHACQESRRAMQACGYELAFAARNSKPRIWFNFKHDILYLASCDRWDHWSRGGRRSRTGPWNISEFPPKDLARVEKAALIEIPDTSILREAISAFGNLKELFCVASHIRVLPKRYEWHTNPAQDPCLDEWGHRETEQDLWGYLECDSTDFLEEQILSNMVERESSWGIIRHASRHYKKDNWGSYEDFWITKTSGLRRLLDYEDFWITKTTQAVDRLQEHKKSVSGSWEIPSIKFVYIVTKKHANIILTRRHRYVQRLLEIAKSEDDEGPRPHDWLLRNIPQNYWAPFVDDCEAAAELYVPDYDD